MFIYFHSLRFHKYFAVISRNSIRSRIFSAYDLWYKNKI